MSKKRRRDGADEGGRPRPSGRVTLNVGGRRFETMRDTLQRADYFAARDRFGASEDDEEMFVDRDGDLFPFILSFLRNNGIPRATTDRLDWDQRVLLAREAEFFGLPDMLGQLVVPPVGARVRFMKKVGEITRREQVFTYSRYAIREGAVTDFDFALKKWTIKIEQEKYCQEDHSDSSDSSDDSSDSSDRDPCENTISDLLLYKLEKVPWKPPKDEDACLELQSETYESAESLEQQMHMPETGLTRRGKPKYEGTGWEYLLGCGAWSYYRNIRATLGEKYRGATQFAVDPQSSGYDHARALM